MRVALAVVASEQLAQRLLAQGRSVDIAVIGVLVGMGHLAAVARVPHHSPLVSGKVERVVQQPAVGLIAGGDIGAHVASHRHG